MRKTILEIYALAICFFSVACFVVTSGVALYDVVQIAAPAITLNRFEYQKFQTDEAFLRSTTMPGKNEAEPKPVGDGALTRRRESAYAQALDAERHDGQQSLLRMVIVMIVDSIAFAIHWRIAGRARQSAA